MMTAGSCFTSSQPTGGGRRDGPSSAFGVIDRADPRRAARPRRVRWGSTAASWHDDVTSKSHTWKRPTGAIFGARLEERRTKNFGPPPSSSTCLQASKRWWPGELEPPPPLRPPPARLMQRDRRGAPS
jgi:hypothetical protein